MATNARSDADLKGQFKVIFASSLGTAFEWYDFFLYGTLASVLGNMFFPSENATAALLKSLAVFGVGFGLRPFGAMLFGVLGDRIGRKYTFLITITLMGTATAGIGLLPTYSQVGIWAPVLLLLLRAAQGLALGGEYGGAAIYVAEHAPPEKRGFYTSWIQMSVVVGAMLAFGISLGSTALVGKEAFAEWGWRIPFLFSTVLLAISLYFRFKLRESPVFQAIKDKGELASNPLRESFGSARNVKLIIGAMIGLAAGLTVIWNCAQFQTLYFLQQTARLDLTTAQTIIMLGSLGATLPQVFFGWLSDKVGRKPVIITGYVLALALLFPLFHTIADAANPRLADAMRRAPVTIENASCGYDPFATKGQATDCGRTLDFFSKQGVSYEKAGGEGQVQVTIGDRKIVGFQPQAFSEGLQAAGYPGSIDAKSGQWTVSSTPAERSNVRMVLAILLMCIISAMTYGPVAAFLVELFPARIRYTSVSLPYHFGTGYFGGFLPFISQYIVAQTGQVFSGLWYTFGMTAVALLALLFLLPETKGRVAE